MFLFFVLYFVKLFFVLLEFLVHVLYQLIDSLYLIVLIIQLFCVHMKVRQKVIIINSENN